MYHRANSLLKRGRVLGFLSSLILVATLLLGGTVGHASPLLDQVCDGTINYYSNIDVFVDKSQTFTVGLAGYLTRVDLRLDYYSEPSADVLFDIRTTAGGVPSEANAGANILFSIVIPKASVPHDFTSWFTIELGAARFPVTPGDQLALCLRSDTDYPYTLAGSSHDPYDFGTHYYRNFNPDYYQPTWTENVIGDADVFFRTWVDPVPVPSAVILLGSGLLGLAGVRRFKKS